MTPPLRKFLSRIALTAVTGLLCAVTAQATPYIFNITKTATPGDVIAIQGSGFGTNPSVVVTDGTHSTTLTLANGGILNSDGNMNISVLAPTNLTNGLIYSVSVINSGTATKQINVPEVHGYLDLAGTEIDSGRSFRIYGNNLSGIGLAVWLNTGTTYLPCTVTSDSDRFVMNVIAPSGLVSGTVYKVFVRSGTNSGYGVQAAQTLTAKAFVSDPFGLGVPWGTDFNTLSANVYNVKTDTRLTLHAAGNGTTDDAAAINAAITTANAAGGGVVYFPTGTYITNSASISVKANVVLKGDGQTLSILKSTPSSATSIVVMSGSQSGLVDLQVYVTPSTSKTTTAGRECTKATGLSKLFALRCTFNQYKPSDTNNLEDYGIRWDYLNQAVIKNCTVYLDAKKFSMGNVYLSNSKDLLLSGNTFTYRDSRIWLDNSTRVQFESNIVNRCNDRIKAATVQNNGGIRFSSTTNLAALGNTIQWYDAADTGVPVVVDSDGESIMAEGPTEDGWGTATAATSTTLSGNFTVAPSTFGDLTTLPHFVMLTKGTGAGQLRAITANTTNQITVSPAWDVTPVSADTGFVIFQKTVENILVRANTINAVQDGVMLSSADAFNVNIVGNAFQDVQAIEIVPFQQSYSHTHSVTKDLVIEGNTCTDTGKWRVSSPNNWYPSTITLEVDGMVGHDLWNTVIYNNSIQAYALGTNAPWVVGGQPVGEGYVAVQHTNGSGDPGVGLMPGLVFDHNLATNCNNAYYLSPTSVNTTIWNSNLVNCGTTWKEWVDAPDFVAYGPYAPSSNLALLKPVAISTYTGHPKGYAAVDGVTSTSFGVTGTAGTQWIIVDTGFTQTVNEVKLDWDAIYYAKSYTIDVSEDGLTNWTTIKTVTNDTSGGVKDWTGLSGIGRYIRVQITAFKSTVCKLQELEVYGPPPSITSALTATGTNGSAFSYQITANYSPTSYSATGLPAGLTINATSGIISGTPTANGAFPIPLFATNLAGTGTSTLMLTVITPFASWRTQKFTPTELLDPSISGDTATPGGDGIVNTIKYALGLQPKLYYSPSAVLPYLKNQNIGGTNFLTFTFTRSTGATDATYVVEAANDLSGTWTGIDPFLPANQVGVLPDAPSPGIQTITIKDTQPASNSSRRFMRLRITVP